MQDLIDLAAERAVLAGVLTHGEDAYLDVADILKPTSFSDPSNQVIWKCIKHLYEEREVKEFDQSLIESTARQLGYEYVNTRPEEIRHLAGIIQTSANLLNVPKYAATVRKLEIARLLREQLKDADTKIAELSGLEPIEVILGIAEQAVFDFASHLDAEEAKGPKLIKEGLTEYLEDIEANPDRGIGISSGWGLYDEAIGGGFRRGTVSLMGARPKVGKSMLAVNIALHTAGKLDIPTLYIDTEMKDEDHWPRCLSNIAYQKGGRVTIREIEEGRYAKNHMKKKYVYEAKQYLESVPFHYQSVIGLSIEETLPIIRRWIHKVVGTDENGKVKECLIIYDYIKLQGASNLSDFLKEYQLLGFIMTTLHNFAGRHNIPIFATIQLNREGERQESGAVLSQSDRILWLVTNFSLFKAKTDEEIAEGGDITGNRKIVPIVARHGEGMREGDYINMFFQNRHGYIRQGDTRDNLQRIARQSTEEADLPDPGELDVNQTTGN